MSDNATGTPSKETIMSNEDAIQIKAGPHPLSGQLGRLMPKLKGEYNIKRHKGKIACGQTYSVCDWKIHIAVSRASNYYANIVENSI